MSTHRVFAQLAFERALGQAAINSLAAAVQDLDQFVREANWPNNPSFMAPTGYDVDAMTAELQQVVEDRLQDVVQGPGLGIIERGELFHQPRIVELVQTARARGAPG